MQSYCTFALLFTSLLSNEYFILLQTLLRAVERNVQTSMRSMNFARCHTALEVSTTNVQWFAVRLVSSRHGTGRNVAAARMHPREAATREHLNINTDTNSNVNFDSNLVCMVIAAYLELMFWYFLAIEADIRHLFAGNYFGRELIAFVKSTSNINWRAIGIVASVDSIWWNATIGGRMDPCETWSGRSLVWK